MLYAPPAVENARTGHLIGHFKENRLVGRERIEFAFLEHENGLLEVLRRHDTGTSQERRQGTLRCAALGDADSYTCFVDCGCSLDRRACRNEISQFERKQRLTECNIACPRRR